MSVKTLRLKGQSCPIDTVLPLNVGDVDLYQSEGQTWMRSGVTSADTTLYPDAYALFEPAAALGTYDTQVINQAGTMSSGALNKSTGDFFVVGGGGQIDKYSEAGVRVTTGNWPVLGNSIGFATGGALASDGISLWLINPGGTKVGKFGFDGAYNPVDDISVAGGTSITNITDATFDGEFFWTTSPDNQYIQKFSSSWVHIPAGGGFFLPSGILRPTGIVWTGGKFWVAEGNAPRLRVGDSAPIAATPSQIREYTPDWNNTGLPPYDISATITNTRGMFMTRLGTFYLINPDSSSMTQYGIGGQGRATIGLVSKTTDPLTNMTNYVKVK